MIGFELKQPKSLQDATNALAEGGVLCGGGQTLLAAMKLGLNSPESVISLGRVDELKGIRTDDSGKLCIGAMTTHADVAESAGAYPALAGLADRIGDPAVRNRGTIGGSLANNDPAACYPAAVLASRAEVVTGSRVIPADDFFVGLFETALDDDEIITEVRFPIPEAASYQKFLQPASRFALVGVFVARFADCVRVAVTGAADEGVHRWGAAEEALSGDFSPSALDGLSVSPDGLIADLHATPAYRANLVRVLTSRAVAAC